MSDSENGLDLWADFPFDKIMTYEFACDDNCPNECTYASLIRRLKQYADETDKINDSHCEAIDKLENRIEELEAAWLEIKEKYDFQKAQNIDLLAYNKKLKK